MSAQGINLKLPPSLYQRMSEMADASQTSLSDVLLQSVQTGLPPSLEEVPERFKADLNALNLLQDDVLLDIIEKDLSQDRQDRYADLLYKNESGTLTEASEEAELSVLRKEADLLMFRRAYAAALLKWRGHRLS